jgi:hypothetical protein
VPALRPSDQSLAARQQSRELPALPAPDDPPSTAYGPKRLRGLLDIGFALYGLLTIGLVAVFIVTGLSPHGFAKAISVLLFIIGTVLATDGVLGLRSGMDRTGKRLRVGRSARVVAGGKLAAGAAAILLLCIGLTL